MIYVRRIYMDAINLIKDDHEEIKSLLEKIQATKRISHKRQALFEKLQKALKSHEEIEEKIFYPRAKEINDLENFILISHEEHHIVDYILEEMLNAGSDETVWRAKFDVLKENIERHIYKEEHKLLPKIKKALNKQEREDLGKEINEFKST